MNANYLDFSDLVAEDVSVVMIPEIPSPICLLTMRKLGKRTPESGPNPGGGGALNANPDSGHDPDGGPKRPVKSPLSPGPDDGNVPLFQVLPLLGYSSSSEASKEKALPSTGEGLDDGGLTAWKLNRPRLGVGPRLTALLLVVTGRWVVLVVVTGAASVVAASADSGMMTSAAVGFLNQFLSLTRRIKSGVSDSGLFVSVGTRGTTSESVSLPESRVGRLIDGSSSASLVSGKWMDLDAASG